ncbi:dephospho-CoA kinase [Pedobacter duraquae]|uniref:Dephospho-CoA kinase n=1 Tax=Pedobacter duraquae TaxID=425511 RepID=A0A4R6IR91_9SPHI|nr:dephospho-CoA kinase [Pedobacter duraquae]TDO24757.1 dephospho-CoA kinase [Pedobacter duraquae]
MLKIGITGGIGSGKTTVCRVFETLGIPVFYADTSAKEIMVKDEILVKGMKETFGAESYTEAGELNRPYISGLVFNDQRQLDQLNALVHPAVFRAFDNWLSTVPSNAPYILKEAALLFESGSYRMCDRSILVTAPLKLKLERVTGRDHTTEAQVLARMDKQLSDEQKMPMADDHITNDGSESLILQVLALHQKYLDKKF